jgi:hypothetical protein
MKRKIFLVLGFLCLWNSAQAQNQLYQSVRGTVIDKSLQGPIPGAIVVLFTEPLLTTTSDEKGQFRFPKVPLGRHRLLIRIMGYKEFQIPQLEVASGKEVVLQLPIEEDIRQASEVVVEGKKDKSRVENTLAVVSAQNMRAAEINRFAGSRSDPSRMASNYAGVSTGGDLRNDIVVRGNSPLGVLWRLEGVDIPNPNHFAFTGTTGGAFSILNNNLLSGADFLTGAFPAEYGNKTAAVFDVRLRNGNNEKRESTAQIGLNGFEFVSEGPMGKPGKASYLASARLFSFGALDAIGVDIGANGIPQYQDGTFKLFFPTEKAGQFTLWGMGGQSSIKMKVEGDDLWESYLKNVDQVFSSSMYAGGLSHAMNYSDKTRGVLSLSASGSKAMVENKELWVEKAVDNAYRLRNTDGQVLGQYVLTHKFNVRNLLRVGATYRHIGFNFREGYFDRSDDRFITRMDQKEGAGLFQTYAQYQYKAHEKFTINPGLYYQHFGLNGSQALEPRLSAVWQQSDRNQFKLGLGMHSQTNPLFVHAYQVTDEKTGAIRRPNRNLDLSRSLQAVLGFQRQVSENLNLKIETYYQHLYEVPVSISHDTGASVYSIINTGADFNMLVFDSTVNKGKGKNYGLEISLERYYDKGFYFLTSASLFRSLYTAADGVERSTLYDLGHVVNFLAGKEFELDENNRRMLSVDIKLTHMGGRRYIPVDEAASLRDNRARYDYSRAYEPQLKGYFRTDLKITYQINRPRANHNLFVAADNLLNTQNMFWQDWNNRKQKVETYYQLGIFPYLGYRVQF